MNSNLILGFHIKLTFNVRKTCSPKKLEKSKIKIQKGTLN